MPFAPRGSREKRARILPPVRLDDEEFAIVERLVEHLSARDGRRYTVSDVVRLGLGRLHDDLLAAAAAAEQPPAEPAKPAPAP